jgi:ketosteroid isomerase-like protein
MSELLTEVYQRFNRRDLEGVLELMAPDVDWPNAWEGGRVHGHQGITDYWTRQWAVLDPKVDPVGFETSGDDVVTVMVHQMVRDLEGAVIADGMVRHRYVIRDGLIQRMDVE